MADLLLDLYGHDPYPQSRSFQEIEFREAVICLDSSLLGQIERSTLLNAVASRFSW